MVTPRIFDIVLSQINIREPNENNLLYITNNEIVQSVTINVAGREAVAKVGTDLVSGQVVEVGQVAVVQNNLETHGEYQYELLNQNYAKIFYCSLCTGTTCC